MSTKRLRITVSGTTGGAGTATANTTSTEVINGRITAIGLQYTGGPPATTDVAIIEVGESNIRPDKPILTVSNASTSGWFHPLAQAVDQTESDITNQGTPITVNGLIKVTVSQANNDDGVIATIEYE